MIISSYKLVGSWRPTGVWLICMLLMGCGAEKESLFEGEHALPLHWPTSLEDAADKIEHRLVELATQQAGDHAEAGKTNRQRCESELNDLVQWIPEVAGDTDLSEAQWLPIYEMCEVMREHLARGDVAAMDIEDDFRKLQVLLKESAQWLSANKEESYTDDSDGGEVDLSGPASSQTQSTQTSTGAEL